MLSFSKQENKAVCSNRVKMHISREHGGSKACRQWRVMVPFMSLNKYTALGNGISSQCSLLQNMINNRLLDHPKPRWWRSWLVQGCFATWITTLSVTVISKCPGVWNLMSSWQFYIILGKAETERKWESRVEFSMNRLYLFSWVKWDRNLWSLSLPPSCLEMPTIIKLDDNNVV